MASGSGNGNGGDLRKLFVGGISSCTTEETMLDYFKQFGDVLGVNIPKNLSTGQSRGFGFVCFHRYDSAQQALNHPEHTINKKNVEVKQAKPKLEIASNSTTSSASSKKLFVGGLPHDCTTAELRAHFETFGVVLDAVVMINPQTGRNRGFGFVTFDLYDDAHRAMESPSQLLKSKLIEVKRYVPKLVNGNHTTPSLRDSGNGHTATNQMYIGNGQNGALGAFVGYNMLQFYYNQLQVDYHNIYAVSPFQRYNMLPYAHGSQYVRDAFQMYPYLHLYGQ